MSSAASRLMPTLRRVVLAGAAADRTDGQLLGAFVTSRDADAFAGLVRRHGPMVLGVCRRVTGDSTVADDAFQAVFIVLARRASAVKPREQVGNWLYGVAYRTALKARAVLARRRSREKQVDVMPEPPVSHPLTAEWADLQPVIDEELARLPDKLRLPVVLCDLEGRAQRDVAKHLGIPPATLATRLATARRTLATRLSKRGVTLSGGALAGLLSSNGTAAAVPHALAHGVARAAEVVAGGGAVSTLVSAHAVQLSEGVMRMMLLSKLKVVAVTALTVAALTGGLGLGLVPAYANAIGDEPVQGEKPAAAKPAEPPVVAIDQFVEEKLKESRINLNADVDDETFLRQLTLVLRGTAPTDIETFFFIADEDKDKRGKVVVWLVDDGDVKAFAAKKLGVAADRVRFVRPIELGTGKMGGLILVVEMGANEKPQALAFSPDGKQLAIEVTGGLTLVDVDGNGRVQNADIDLPLYTLTRRARLTGAAQPGAHDAIWIDGPARLTLNLNATGTDAKLAKTWWSFFAQDPKNPKARVWDSATGQVFADFDSDGRPDVFVDGGTIQYFKTIDFTTGGETDVDFLKRVIKDVRGGTPTALEQKYFSEDKDPKKREKLLDTLLKDPIVAKKLGDDWKKKMLASQASALTPNYTFEYQLLPLDPKKGEWKYELKVDPKNPGVWKQADLLVPNTFQWKHAQPLEFKFKDPTSPTPAQPPVANDPKGPPKPPQPQADKLDKIVGELLAAKKSDADILDGITLVVLGRLPTDAEKKLTLGLVTKSADRKAAWLEVAKALAATSEGKQRSDAIELKGTITGSGDSFRFHLTPEVRTLPPAKK